MINMITNEEKERYQRQILIIGKNGQELLKQKKVLQVGAGGLGSPLSLYLVSSGIGELILFENDFISLSNLGRQILYTTDDVNKSKGDLAKTYLTKLNPNTKITLINERFTEKSAEKYLKNEQIDYLVDASDNFETKFLINDSPLTKCSSGSVYHGPICNRPFLTCSINSDFLSGLISK